MSVIVLGSINMDVVTTAPRHPQPGETLFGHDVHFIPGGKGSNQAVAAGRLGGDTHLVGRLGQDAFGATLNAFLRDEGLHLDHLHRLDDAPTGTALITVSDAGENTIVVVSGANKRLTADDTASVTLKPGDVVLSQFEVPQTAIRALFSRARSAGAKTVLNPAPAEPFIDGLFDVTDVLVVNEIELAFFGDTSADADDATLAEAARRLRQRADQWIVVTLGKRGALCIAGDDTLRVPGEPVQAVDTTGAGDCFVGALAVALDEGQPLPDALRFANHAAAISVQRLGASASLPRRDEVSGD